MHIVELNNISIQNIQTQKVDLQHVVAIAYRYLS